MKGTRLNSRLESEGAEFLVLGHLLIEGIAAYKHYVNGRGYDLVAIAPDGKCSALIQVKSRWATNANSFLLGRVECDFFVFVWLNRGVRKRGVVSGESGDPKFYVVPANVAKNAVRSGKWGSKVPWKALIDVEQFRNDWGSIRTFIGGARS